MKFDASDETKRIKIKKNFKKSKQPEIDEPEPEHKDMMKTKPCNRGTKTPMKRTRQDFCTNESEPTQTTTSKTERGAKALNLNSQGLVDILAGCKAEINKLRTRNAFLESQNRELTDKVKDLESKAIQFEKTEKILRRFKHEQQNMFKIYQELNKSIIIDPKKSQPKPNHPPKISLLSSTVNSSTLQPRKARSVRLASLKTQELNTSNTGMDNVWSPKNFQSSRLSHSRTSFKSGSAAKQPKIKKTGEIVSTLDIVLAKLQNNL
jgi:hypothetical protein